MLGDLVESMKKAALDAIEASYPATVMFGVVIGVNPLWINVEQKMTLGRAQLVLTRNVTEYTVEMTVDHWTDNENDHLHAYKGKKAFQVHHNLKVNDEVVLLRMQGGQKFVVLDRIG